jgi:hypothetical protein
MRKPERIKKIGGHLFHFETSSSSKREIQKMAISKRKDGYQARVIKAGPWHGKVIGDLKKGRYYYILYVGGK